MDKHNDLINQFKNLNNFKYNELDNRIFLFYPKNINKNYKNIFIISTFHGEENSCVYGLLNFLKNYNTKLNISFIPIVNVKGFLNQIRYDEFYKIDNSAYIHNEILKQDINENDKIVKNNINKILYLGKDGILCLHEDKKEKNSFYLYSYIKNKNSLIPKIILDRMKRIYNDNINIQSKIKDFYPFFGNLEYKENQIICNNIHDGSFEDLCFHNNIPVILTTETPINNNFNERIDANEYIISIFCDLIIFDKN